MHGLRRNRPKLKALGPKSEALASDRLKIQSKAYNQSNILPKLVSGSKNVKNLEEMEKNNGRPIPQPVEPISQSLDRFSLLALKTYLFQFLSFLTLRQGL